jgi:formyltetrahydrofolate synthetase
MADHWAKGGSGAVDLAHAVEKACLQKVDFKFLYDLRVDNSTKSFLRNLFLVFSYLLKKKFVSSLKKSMEQMILNFLK